MIKGGWYTINGMEHLVFVYCLTHAGEHIFRYPTYRWVIDYNNSVRSGKQMWMYHAVNENTKEITNIFPPDDTSLEVSKIEFSNPYGYDVVEHPKWIKDWYLLQNESIGEIDYTSELKRLYSENQK